ncbi:hypothetical protein [Winogradskyella immobilis]|uniref:SGNH/GDSL hydrolase family protein n=1 Tax=Winogradskyella immobilis TaxID=2816852 RepID=A0ABS8ENU8_9FLAO|nr:hypothetical protein [Winogradskyella immobilis]MCC1484898.1 hypothetical protein [Winogradskyella immobilis]MCG0016990.1 hypothetical protein [Winogradskyella immobilis]
MKKFLLNIILFIIPIAITLYPFDVFISKSLAKSNKYPGNYTAWNDIYNGKASSDVLIFGSSRATHHIDPDILKDSLNLKVYNFGVNGHGFWLQYLKYIEYLKHNKPPQHIIIGADWFSLEKRPDLYQYNQFLPYMLWNRTIKDYTNSYIGFRYLDYYVPALRYFGNSTAKERTITYAFKDAKKIKPYKTRGYRALYDRKKQGNTENLSIRENYNVKIDGETVDLLNSFLTDCKEEGIQVSLVYTPEYFDEQRFIINRKDAIKIYTDLSIKYNIPFLDYSSGEISRDINYFNSTMHLNSSGAELFSMKLVHDLLQNK